MQKAAKWMMEVKRRAVEQGGSWEKASEYILDSCFHGCFGGRNQSVMVNLGHLLVPRCVSRERETPIFMCLNSMWHAARTLLRDVRDADGAVCSGAEAFMSRNFLVFSAKARARGVKATCRRLLLAYADEVVAGQNERTGRTVFWGRVRSRMEAGGQATNMSAMGLHEYFRDHNLGDVLVSTPVRGKAGGGGMGRGCRNLRNFAPHLNQRRGQGL